jgi:hypothetical protein
MDAVYCLILDRENLPYIFIFFFRKDPKDGGIKGSNAMQVLSFLSDVSVKLVSQVCKNPVNIYYFF